jgi:oxalate decarboxylase
MRKTTQAGSIGASNKDAIDRRSLFEAVSRVSLGLAATAVIADQVKAAPSGETKSEELEPFKYDINSEKGWIGPGGSAREATVKQLPVSQSIAGVSVTLAPGAIRELHWHALASERAYVLTGRCRTTVIAPNGQAEVDDFEEGDTWYFPRGHGHAIQNTGPAECHFLLGFDNGHFSEIRHVQHHRLDRDHASTRVGAKPSSSRIGIRPGASKGTIYRPGSDSAGRGSGA